MPRTRVNKSEAVRQYLAQNPQATAREVVEALKSQGISIKSQLVYGLKSRTGKTGGRKTATTAARSTSGNGNMADFFSVLDLARKIGVSNLREIANRLPE